MEKIKVVVKRPGEPAQVDEINAKLSAYRELVGGTLDWSVTPFNHDIYVLLHDEGKLINLPPNLVVPEHNDVYVGTCVFLGVGVIPGNEYGERDFIGLTDEQIEMTLNFCASYDIDLNGYTTCISELRNGLKYHPYSVVFDFIDRLCLKYGISKDNIVREVFDLSDEV